MEQLVQFVSAQHNGPITLLNVLVSDKKACLCICMVLVISYTLFLCTVQVLDFPLRLFNGSDIHPVYQGELQVYFNRAWRPVCSSTNMDSVTANKICQSVGFRLALNTFDYNYTENDAIFDEIYCNGFSQSCTYKLHAQGQPCDSLLAKGITCSDGKIQACLHLPVAILNVLLE